MGFFPYKCTTLLLLTDETIVLNSNIQFSSLGGKSSGCSFSLILVFVFLAERSHSDRPQRAVGERHAYQPHQKLHPALPCLLQVSKDRKIWTEVLYIFVGCVQYKLHEIKVKAVETVELGA